jgi:hypothetical protein
VWYAVTTRKIGVLPHLILPHEVNAFPDVIGVYSKSGIIYDACREGIVGVLDLLAKEEMQKESYWRSLCRYVIEYGPASMLSELLERAPQGIRLQEEELEKLHKRAELDMAAGHSDFNQFLVTHRKALQEGGWQLDSAKWRYEFSKLDPDQMLDKVNEVLLMPTACDMLDCLFQHTRPSKFIDVLHGRLVRYYAQPDPRIETFLINYQQSLYAKATSRKFGAPIKMPIEAVISFAQVIRRARSDDSNLRENLLQGMKRDLPLLASDRVEALQGFIPFVLKTDDVSLYEAFRTAESEYCKSRVIAHTFLAAQVGAKKIFTMLCSQDNARIGRMMMGDSFLNLRESNPPFADILVSMFFRTERQAGNQARLFKVRHTDGKLYKVVLEEEASDTEDDAYVLQREEKQKPLHSQ